MTLTFEDLKASIGKGPCLDSSDIANTYYSDEEFLSALDRRVEVCPSEPGQTYSTTRPPS